MLGWLGRLVRRTPLAGAPPVRRLKTYSALSGYVYEYVFEGSRPVRDSAEFVFSVSADRHNFRRVTVILEAAAVACWERGHDRELSANERHALATMALRQALDERESPALAFEPVQVRPDGLAGLAETLGLE